MSTIKVLINGKNEDLPNNCTPELLLLNLEIPKQKVAIECNQKIIPRSSYNDFIIKEGDVIEIVHFVGGG